MEEKDILLIVQKAEEAVGKKFTEKFEEAKAGLITAEKFAEGLKGLVSAEEVKTITESVEKLAIEVKKLSQPVDVEKTIRKIIESQKDALEAVASGRKDVTAKFNMKDAVVTGTSWTDSRLAMRIPGVNEPAHRLPAIQSLFMQFDVEPELGGAIRYLDQSSQTRAAAARSENVAAAESAIVFTEYVLALQNISDSIPVTKESLKNFSYLEGILRKFLNINLALAEETEVYSGDGSAPNLTGLTTSATAFNPATMISKKVNDASHYDLIRYLASYIASGKNSKYRPNYALLNDMDVWAMMGKKDANQNYILPPFVRMVGEQIFVGGVQVIPSSLVTTNTMVVGDFNQGEYHRDPNFELSIGWVNTDFTQNRITLLGNKQANLLIKTLDATAFYKVTDIDAALAALTA